MNEMPQLLAFDAARAMVLELASRRATPGQQLALGLAHGRFLAEDQRAPRDLPPFANSAMDGFALRGVDLPLEGERSLRIVGTLLAGSASSATVGAGECMRITTGAPMPDGADTVVIKERVRADGDCIVVAAGELPGANVRPAGEDFPAGGIVARSGQRVTSARLAAIASLGLAEVRVARKPRVALMTSGDELAMPGRPLGTAQIYNSNGYSLSALIALAGAELMAPDGAQPGTSFGHLRDDPAAVRIALTRAARGCDVIVTSGGVSAGEADFLSGAIADIGRVHFWKVRMRPGMPFLCGEVGEALVFCLPGNPVSTIATFLGFVRPALVAMQGSSDPAPRMHTARLATAFRKRHDRTEFVRAKREIDANGTVWVRPLPQQGSAMLRGVIDADSLIVIPDSTQALEIGEMVQVMSLEECF